MKLAAKLLGRWAKLPAVVRGVLVALMVAVLLGSAVSFALGRLPHWLEPHDTFGYWGGFVVWVVSVSAGGFVAIRNPHRSP